MVVPPAELASGLSTMWCFSTTGAACGSQLCTTISSGTTCCLSSQLCSAPLGCCLTTGSTSCRRCHDVHSCSWLSAACCCCCCCCCWRCCCC
ncbi:hypothetical protein COO60DRAFT_680041 [Scenedesmus sp. NREL 46B-D3]|nr:hypothetical protein COO60DRAFT_680041 [Scenedesmus sp. NREL 46B-D3]